MTQALGPVGPFLYAFILVSFGIGLPIIVVLAIRFLYYRHMSLGGSRELDKLVWQLHRIATALEHEKGLSFSAEQPGTEQGDAKVVAQRASPQSPSPKLLAARLPEPKPPAPRRLPDLKNRTALVSTPCSACSPFGMKEAGATCGIDAAVALRNVFLWRMCC